MPPEKRTLDEVLRIAEDVLRSTRVEHVFVGGATILAFGMPRTTSRPSHPVREGTGTRRARGRRASSRHARDTFKKPESRSRA